MVAKVTSVHDKKKEIDVRGTACMMNITWLVSGETIRCHAQIPCMCSTTRNQDKKKKKKKGKKAKKGKKERKLTKEQKEKRDEKEQKKREKEEERKKEKEEKEVFSKAKKACSCWVCKGAYMVFTCLTLETFMILVLFGLSSLVSTPMASFLLCMPITCLSENWSYFWNILLFDTHLW